MQEGMDTSQLLSGVLRMADAFLPPRQSNNFFPYDLLENEKMIKIYVEIPGVSPQSLSIDFFNNKLKIHGEKLPYQDEGFEVKKQQISQEDAELSIMLPLAITNRENVKVKLDRGILCISIDKEAEAKNSFSLKVDE